MITFNSIRRLYISIGAVFVAIALISAGCAGNSELSQAIAAAEKAKTELEEATAKALEAAKEAEHQREHALEAAREAAHQTEHAREAAEMAKKQAHHAEDHAEEAKDAAREADHQRGHALEAAREAAHEREHALEVIGKLIEAKTIHHTVVKGESLWNIAEQIYKDPLLWHKIYENNEDKIENPDLIYPSQVFVVSEE